MLISFVVAKFSPLQRSFDGLCGNVYPIFDPEMFLPNHPGVPKKLHHLKYFVAGFGSRVENDSTAQRKINIWAYSSRSRAERRASELRKRPTAVHHVSRTVRERFPLGVVSRTRDRHRVRVFYNSVGSVRKFPDQSRVEGRIDYLDFNSTSQAERFADKLWSQTTPDALPFLSPSKATVLSAMRLSSKRRSEQFFSVLRNLVSLAAGTAAQSKKDRARRRELDSSFSTVSEASEHAKRHRPKHRCIVATAPLPSLLAQSPRDRPQLTFPLQTSDPYQVLEALAALLPDDPHRTQATLRKMKSLRGEWVDEKPKRRLEKWQVDALRLRLQPSGRSFTKGWRMWKSAKKTLRHDQER